MKPRRLTSRLAIAIFALMLALGLMLVPALAASIDTLSSQNARTEEEIKAAVGSMLAAGDYTEGEAIVCSLKGSSGRLMATKDGAADLLASAEELSTVTKDQFNEAVGLTEDEPGEPVRLRAQKGAGTDAVEILLVHKDGMTTEALLTALLQDSRVLSAEPNYILSFGDVDDDIDVADAADPIDIANAADPMDVDVPAADDPSADIPAPDELDEGNAPAADDPVKGDTPSAEVPAADDGAEPSRMLAPEPAAVPSGTDRYAYISDDLTSYQWMNGGYDNAIPQLIGATNPGINSPSWNTPGETNSSGVVVILDSGVDYTHPDLKNVMYHFSPELQTELGCGEYGYAPAREDKTDPMDGYGHGTHCAGIVAAEWNGFGVSGVASGAKIVAVSVSQSVENSSFGYDAMIRGYDFMLRAVKAGVDIRSVNRSLEASPINTANQAMVIAAGEAGIVTCIASGNNTVDMDTTDYDTSMYQANPYILRVNASKGQDDYAWFSNYGTYTTDVYAPGVSILSTVPSNQATFSRYYPQADDDPLYLETSFDTDFDIYDSDLYDPGYANFTVNGISKGTVGIDGDGKSLAIDASITGEVTAKFYIDVPVDSLDLNNIQDMSVALYSPDFELRFLDVGIILDGNPTPYSGYEQDELDEPLAAYLDDEPEDQEPEYVEVFSTSDIYDVTIRESNSSGAPCDWAIASFHLYDPSRIESDILFVTDSQGRKCIRLVIAGSMQVEGGNYGNTVNGTIYLDRIAIGKPGNSGFLPYQYMNGTSMATPVVTGAAAVVSSSIQGVSLSERASQTVELLKGTVHQADGYKDLCKQNGQIDLSFLSGQVALTPVLNEATTKGNALVLFGANFGAGGTLTVNGTPIEASSWTDTTIMATWPAGLESGLIKLSVTSGAGISAQRAFMLEAPASAGASAVLYERDLEPISVYPGHPSVTAAPQALTAAEDGTLYAAAANGEGQITATVGYLMKSDDAGKTWTTIELPQQLKEVSLAAGNGKVYIMGATPADDAVMITDWYLYAFDVETSSIELLRSYEMYTEEEEIKCAGRIAYVNGYLYFLDTESIEDYSEETGWSYRAYIRARRFADDYSLLGTYTFNLGHEFNESEFYAAPLVSVTKDCIYVATFGNLYNEEDIGKGNSLQRVDVAADGTLTSVDLSESLKTLSISMANVSIAANDQGVFLIGLGLEGLVSEGAPATDTYFLKKGATTFESYGKRLSYGEAYSTHAICADGWLYAYATSKYEPMPQFGRATKLAEVKQGWIKDDGKWHYYLEDGTQLKDGWASYNGKWYYFDADGELLREGWASYQGKWYYIKDYTPMKEGWASYAGKWYYIKDYNPMKEGWASYKGKWYYIKNYTPMKEGWARYAGKWYYIKNYTPMPSGWVRYQGFWYCIKNYNPIVSGWFSYLGTWYHFTAKGICDRIA